jgi:polyhydroxybutyrate depolymerase
MLTLFGLGTDVRASSASRAQARAFSRPLWAALLGLAALGCGDGGAAVKGTSTAPAVVDAGAVSAALDAASGAPVLDAARDVPLPIDGGADARVDAQTSPSLDAALDAALSLDAASADARAAADASLDAASPDSGAQDASADSASPGDGGVSLPAALPRTVKVGSTDRTFLLYVPMRADKSKPMPLVSVHHGFTMSGKIMEEITSWKSIAEREGVVIAFADGGDYLGPWNVGENVCNIGQVVAGSPDQDDLGFVKAIIESAQATQPINRAQVFVAGFSMGGYFANHVGCQGRAFARAVSAHSGGTYSGACPGDPLPVLLIHGDADGLIDYECATQARGYWIERNGCTSQVMSETIKGGGCDWNQGCPKGLELGLCTMKGMDHGWAGAPTTGPGAWLTAPLDGNAGYGGGVQYEDAAELMWKFFKRYL